ncbi:MAG: hypothetical protein SGPRY_014727, partial [Prymnesium sp.]
DRVQEDSYATSQNLHPANFNRERLRAANSRKSSGAQPLAPPDVQRLAVEVIEAKYSFHKNAKPSHLFRDGKSTQQAEWGKLSFPWEGGSDSFRRPAEYIRISQHSSAVRLARILAKFWKIERPSLLLSVAGGVASLELPPRLLNQAFARGLFNTCKSTRTLIITGGASSGVSALVAGAFTKSHHPPPIVGFMPWEKVLGNHCLKDNHGESKPRNYFAGASNSAAGWLDAHHSHFVLVDAGEACGWQSELRLRQGVQQTYAQIYNVPCVLLVVQGGRGTLLSVQQALRIATPVVLAAGSGGVADAISRYC